MKKVMFLCATLMLCYANTVQDAEKALEDKDFDRAYKIFKSLCDKNEADSCIMTAFMHEIGVGADKDTAKAIEYYSKACKLGHEMGCDAEKNFKEQKHLR